LEKRSEKTSTWNKLALNPKKQLKIGRKKRLKKRASSFSCTVAVVS
jgi:hypothetical protein